MFDLGEITHLEKREQDAYAAGQQAAKGIPQLPTPGSQDPDGVDPHNFKQHDLDDALTNTDNKQLTSHAHKAIPASHRQSPSNFNDPTTPPPMGGNNSGTDWEGYEWQQAYQRWMMLQAVAAPAPSNSPETLTAWQRVKAGMMGALWGVGAAASGFAAVVTAETGVGAAFFGAGAVYATDHGIADINEAWTGHREETYLEQGLEHYLSPNTAHEIDLGLGLGLALPDAIVLGVKGVQLGAQALRDVGLFGSKAAARSEMRARVLGNIAESKAAREATGFPVLSAKIDQMSGGYLPDTWEMTTLRKGEVVYGGLPGQSAYYTDFDTTLVSQGDKASLGQSLQIRPNIKLGYRPYIARYEVLHDVRVPTGHALQNTNFGAGAGRQFFIGNYSATLRLVQQYDLEEFYAQEQLPTNSFNP